jgi:dTDP-4-dehydrorhamnose reductase
MLLNEIKKYMPLAVKVDPCSILGFDLPEKRPIDVSMKPDKLIKATGIQLGYPRKACERIVEKFFKSASPDIIAYK